MRNNYSNVPPKGYTNGRPSFARGSYTELDIELVIQFPLVVEPTAQLLLRLSRHYLIIPYTGHKHLLKVTTNAQE